MHDHIVNASIQILPIVQDRHPYSWVDEAISIIQQSTISYEVGPFSTVLEGKYAEVLKVINDINDHLQISGCEEWITNVQIQIRSNKDICGNEKTDRYNTGAQPS